MDFYFKRFAFLLFFLVSSLSLFSQNHKIDSLKRELRLHLDKDTLRVNILNDLAYAHFKKDKKKTFSYLEEAETMATALGYKKGKAKSLYLRGMLEAFESNYRKGFSKYKEAIELYKTIGWEDEIAECYKEMGIFMYQNGNQREAIKYYNKSLELLDASDKKQEIAILFYELGWSYIEIDDYTKARSFLSKGLKINEELKNESRMSSCLSGIAITYSNQGNYPLALDYYNQTLEIARKNSNSRRIMLTMGNIGTLYNKYKKYDKAIEFFNKTLKLSESTDKVITSRTYMNLGLAYRETKNNELAFEYLKKSQKLYNEVNDKRGEAFSLNNIGYTYLQTKNYTKAHRYYEQGRKLSLKFENPLGLCTAYLGLARINYHTKNYDEAFSNALKSQEISLKHGFLQDRIDILQLLSKIHKSKGAYKKAFENYQQYKILNDSLFNKENIEKITQLEYEYKYKQALDSASIRELQLTKKVTATNQDLAKSQRNYLWAIIGVLLVSILLGSIIFFQKFKNIKTQNENIAIEQKLLRSQMTPHFIFNSLSVLQGMMLNKEDEKSVSYLSKFSKLLRLTLENSRDKTVLLSEEMAAIENYLALQSLENKAFLHSVIVEEAIDTTSLKIPPMLIQPFIENAVEHAFVNQSENQKIAVHLKKNDVKLICTITDNGIGIDSQKRNTQKHKKSLATTITSERLQLLAEDLKMKGSVTVEDRKKYHEKGTLVTLVIPYVTIV